MDRPRISLIHKQFAYLKYLRRLSLRKLRKLHDKVFRGSRYMFSLPGGIPRDFIERRIWTYFCCKNYHYEKGHPVRTEFFRRAKEILSNTKVSELPPEEAKRERAREHSRFSWDKIQSMPRVELERSLAVAGIYVETTVAMKRQLLYELYHKPKEELPEEVIRNNKTSALNNKYVLRDIVIENPRMDYSSFRKTFGNVMPTVSRTSYNSTRTHLRKAGYKLPVLRPGPRNPAIIDGKAARPWVNGLDRGK